MVDEQLIPRGITDPDVLAAFRRVPRHEFVPQEYWDEAYGDHPIPIGNGQTISQPYMVALMTECLRLKGSERVLEIGAGSGYQAAIIAELAESVISVERIAPLANKCRDTLKHLGYGNASVVVGDGTLGYERESPYDGIIVTCAAPSLPKAYIEQLSESGRVVIPVGARFSQVLTVLERAGSELIARDICGCVFVPLIGKDGWKT